MIDSALKPGNHHLDIADVERRVKAIVIGSVGNLVEWYDFYAYTAFAVFRAGLLSDLRPRGAAAQAARRRRLR